MSLSKEEFHALDAKADWEGGWPEYILGYGGVTDRLDNDLLFANAIKNFEHAWTVVHSFIEKYREEFGEYMYE